jgi:uncharacterized membrane protein
MKDGARIAGHPIHPILVTLPLGLLTFSFVADLVRMFGGGPVWSTVAFYTLGAGIVGIVLAAVPGLIDFLTITDRRVRDIALAHLVTNVVVLGIFAFSFWLRWIATVGVLPLVVSAAGVILLGIGGWLGGEMVFKHGMGMAPSATGQEKEKTARRRAA